MPKYTLDQMAQALARREVIKAIAENNVLIFDLDDIEKAMIALMEHKNFHADAILYLTEWSRLDAMEIPTNVIPIRRL